MYSQIIILCSILLYPQDFNAIVWSWFWSPCSVSKGEFGCLFVFSTWSLFLMIKFYFHYLIFKYFFLYLMFYCLKYDLFNNLISISYLMSTFLFTFWTLLKVWCFILTLFFFIRETVWSTALRWPQGSHAFLKVRLHFIFKKMNSSSFE